MTTREIASEYRLAQRTEKLREQKASGQNIRQWCEENGISQQRYFYWQRKLRQAVSEALPSAQTGLCPTPRPGHMPPTAFCGGLTVCALCHCVTVTGPPLLCLDLFFPAQMTVHRIRRQLCLALNATHKKDTPLKPARKCGKLALRERVYPNR